MKANQPKLDQEIEKQSLQQTPVRKYLDSEKTRDRNSKRIVEVYELPKNLA